MLEANAHKNLKNLLRQNSSTWPHHLTFSRLVARSLRRKDHTLIKLESIFQNEWWLGLMVPLCLEECGGVLVLSQPLRRRFLNVELPRLHSFGFSLGCWEGSKPPPLDQIWLLDVGGLIEAYEKGFLKNRQLIIPEAEFFVQKLRDAMTIEVSINDWERLRHAYPSLVQSLIQLYEGITLRLFAIASRSNSSVLMDGSDLRAVQKEIASLSLLPSPWQALRNIHSDQWALWAQLDHKMLNWVWQLQPLEPLELLQGLLTNQPAILISGAVNTSLTFAESPEGGFPKLVVVSLNEPNIQDPIPLYMPRRQPLLNTEIFADYLLQQCLRLILGRTGLTIILLDDPQLRLQLATALAAEFGKRISHETTSPDSNGVVCCRWEWWLNHQDQLPAPEQLIIGLLPLASLESPLIASRVEAFKRKGLDWFRGFLLPEALCLIPPALTPLRRTCGRLAILDGRVRSRSWGGDVLQVLQPCRPLNRLLPD